MYIAERPIKQRHAIRSLIAENNSETTRQCDNPTLFHKPPLQDLPSLLQYELHRSNKGYLVQFLSSGYDGDVNSQEPSWEVCRSPR